MDGNRFKFLSSCTCIHECYVVSYIVRVKIITKFAQKETDTNTLHVILNFIIMYLSTDSHTIIKIDFLYAHANKKKERSYPWENSHVYILFKYI